MTVEPKERERARLLNLANAMRALGEQALDEGCDDIEVRAGLLVVSVHAAGVFRAHEGLAEFAGLPLIDEDGQGLTTTATAEVFRRTIVWLKEAVCVEPALRPARETHHPTADGCRLIEEIIRRHVDGDVSEKAAALTPLEARIIATIEDAGRPLTQRELEEKGVGAGGNLKRAIADLQGRGRLFNPGDGKGNRTAAMAHADALESMRWAFSKGPTILPDE